MVKDEKSNSSLVETSPPVMCTSSAHVTNLSSRRKRYFILDTDKEVLSILEALEETADVSAINKTRLSGYSDTAFNLSRRVLTEIEVKILKKVLTMLLFKINSTSRILMSFAVKCVLNGIFVIDLLLNLVLHLLLSPNLRGNILMTVLVWNFFKAG